jgi:uncharacterized protein (DUF433 family)
VSEGDRATPSDASGPTTPRNRTSGGPLAQNTVRLDLGEPVTATGTGLAELSPRSVSDDRVTAAAPERHSSPAYTAAQPSKLATYLRLLWAETARDFAHISVDSETMQGQPTVDESNVTVAQVCALAAAGRTPAEISKEFNGFVSVEGAKEALRFAARLATQR